MFAPFVSTHSIQLTAMTADAKTNIVSGWVAVNNAVDVLSNSGQPLARIFGE
jgi:hypothetical protein